MGKFVGTLMLLMVLLLQMCIFTVSSYDDFEPSEDEWLSATATFSKEPNASLIFEGACGYGDLHKTIYGRYGTGLSTMLFNKGSVCGGCFEIRCVDHVKWCKAGSPSVVVTATDFCPPNNGLSAEYGGWCNFPNEHFEMSLDSFSEIAVSSASVIPIQYRRVDCERDGGMKFTVTGNANFYQVLITNVGLDGQVVAVKIKGSRTGWIPMARNWGQYWQCNINLKGQPLSFEVTTSSGKTVRSFNVAPSKWEFGQTFEGRQIYS
nr:EXPA20 [Colobanthus quitensis]